MISGEDVWVNTRAKMFLVFFSYLAGLIQPHALPTIPFSFDCAAATSIARSCSSFENFKRFEMTGTSAVLSELPSSAVKYLNTAVEVV